jgi:hypothetical protein
MFCWFLLSRFGAFFDRQKKPGLPVGQDGGGILPVNVVVKNPGLFVRGEVHGPILRWDRAAVDGAEVPILILVLET